jgi:hypothetical protein
LVWVRRCIIDGPISDVVVDRFHPLFRERTSVLTRLLTDLPEARIHGRIVAIARFAIEHAARTELLAERGIFRIVRQLGLFFRVEVIEVAVELVEPMHRREELVPIAEMILADLRRRISERLQQRGDGWILLLQARRRTRQADLGHSGSETRLAGDERRAARRAALLGVGVGEHHAFFCKPIDVGCAIAHHTVRVGADVRLSDVVAPDHDDVGPSFLRLGNVEREQRQRDKQ